MFYVKDTLVKLKLFIYYYLGDDLINTLNRFILIRSYQDLIKIIFCLTCTMELFSRRG